MAHDDPLTKPEFVPNPESLVPAASPDTRHRIREHRVGQPGRIAGALDRQPGLAGGLAHGVAREETTVECLREIQRGLVIDRPVGAEKPTAPALRKRLAQPPIPVSPMPDCPIWQALRKTSGCGFPRLATRRSGPRA